MLLLYADDDNLLGDSISNMRTQNPS